MTRAAEGEPRSTRSPETLLVTLRALLQFSPAHARLVPLLALFGLAISFAEILVIGLVVLFLYSMIGDMGQATAAPTIIGRGFALVAAKLGGGAGLAAMIFGLVVVNAAMKLAYSLIIASVRYRLCEITRNRLHQQFLQVSYAFILAQDRGQLFNTLSGESWLMGEMYLCICRILIGISSIVIFLLVMLVVSWQLLFVAAIGIGMLFAGLNYLSRPARKLGRRMREDHEILAERMLVTLQGMRTLRAFAQEERYQHAFETVSAGVRRVSMAFERLNCLASPVVQIGSLLLLAVIILLSNSIGAPSAATLTFVALFYRLQPYFHDLNGNLLYAAQLEGTARHVIDMLDPSDKTYLPSGKTPFGGLRREIRFEAVSFSYPGSPSSSLDQVGFVIPAGTTTALVGRSGAGKTTIVNLLLRLYRQDSGAISVDGVSLDELEQKSWLSRIAAAGQDVELVEGTVRENLRIASSEAELPAIRSAAEIAKILDVIESFPDGFDSWIGQQGLKLSSGERQRLGLARVLLRDPEILILDEATNALDHGLEREILGALRRRLAGRTLLVISHRLETLMSADQVICIDSGKVLESGPPAELRSRPGSTFCRLLNEMADASEGVASG